MQTPGPVANQVGYHKDLDIEDDYHNVGTTVSNMDPSKELKIKIYLTFRMMMSIHLITMVIMLVPYQACNRPLKGFNKDILGVKDDDHQSENNDHNMKHAGL